MSESISVGKKKITLGILAHVDAGKTTLSEAMLYLSGRLRTLGRVDHKSAYLDTNPMERERGITIFSKQARLSTELCDIVLLDTPGHSDFGAETERTLSVLDYAILLIGGENGVRSHTLTLWKLLKKKEIPTFVFVNKTDLPNSGEDAMLETLCRTLDAPLVSFSNLGDVTERAAESDELLLEEYLETGTVEDASISAAIAERRIVPCLFGSALRLEGVTELLDVIGRYTLETLYPTEGFAARVYKIGRENAATGVGNRLTYLKVTGGALSVRDEIAYETRDGRSVTEKVAQIRLYSGDKYEQVMRAEAGEICAVIGLSETYIGAGLGMEKAEEAPTLIPVLSYRLALPEGCDPKLLYPKLCALAEEDPSLKPVFHERSGEICIHLMGEVHTEILCRMIRDRYGVEVTVEEGTILYKETIEAPVEGVGHFEPLRHYAEVHLSLEPLPRGSGVIFLSSCPTDVLERSWQRLILSFLEEKEHLGVLIGAPLTDVKITLLLGKAHMAHTDGGDFREATYRAVRQGLMGARSILLEPYYSYRLEVPDSQVGRAMHDLQMRHGSCEIESADHGKTVLSGRVPVSEIRNYSLEVASYTHGEGRLGLSFDGYEPCHNTAEVVEKYGYLPTRDLENTPNSVFCAHGASFIVPWDHVREYMHVDSGYLNRLENDEKTAESVLPSPRSYARTYHLDDKELEAIMLREFGPIKRRKYGEPKTNRAPQKGKSVPYKPKKEHIIVDGYNVIFGWDFLKRAAEYHLEGAREQLCDILANYVSYTHRDVTLVFDAYRTPGNAGSETKRDGYTLVYTAEHETADAYMERLMHRLGPDYTVRVVTSDRLVQFSAVHAGILRTSVREFEEEIERMNLEISAFIQKLSKE